MDPSHDWLELIPLHIAGWWLTCTVPPTRSKVVGWLTILSKVLTCANFRRHNDARSRIWHLAGPLARCQQKFKHRLTSPTPLEYFRWSYRHCSILLSTRLKWDESKRKHPRHEQKQDSSGYKLEERLFLRDLKAQESQEGPIRLRSPIKDCI